MQIPSKDSTPAKSPLVSRTSRLRVFEACLVIGIAFGSSIISSILPLVGDSNSNEFFRILYSWISSAIDIIGGVAILIYVIIRKLHRTSHTGYPLTSLLVTMKQIGFVEWLLILAVASWSSLSYLAYYGLQGMEWMPISILRNWSGLRSVIDMVIGLAVLAYVLQQSGRSWRDIGLTWSSRAAVLALPVLLLDQLISRIQAPAIYWLGRTLESVAWRPPNIGFMLHGDTTEILEVAEVLLVGFYEELIVRAYLMTEIIALTRSAWLAVVVSVVVQSSYHFYQGVPLALSHVLLFTVYALFYVRTRMVLPLALAHSLADINAVWSYGLKTMSFG